MTGLEFGLAIALGITLLVVFLLAWLAHDHAATITELRTGHSKLHARNRQLEEQLSTHAAAFADQIERDLHGGEQNG